VKDRRFLIGLVLTIAWLCIGGYIFASYPRPTQLSDWGGFFGGFFAPVAFLWLVLGYVQQGEELRHSAEALRLQAEELRSSVEQQSQLVAVSREQMQHDLNVAQEERERRKDAARPKFVVQNNGSVSSSGQTTHKLKLVNVGNTATSLRMTFNPPLEAPESVDNSLLARDGAWEFGIRLSQLRQSTASISYFDADGLPGQAHFTLKEAAPGRLEYGGVVRVQ